MFIPFPFQKEKANLHIPFLAFLDYFPEDD